MERNLIACWMCIAALACNSSEQSSPAAEAPQPAATDKAAPAAADEAAQGPVAEDATFRLALSQASDSELKLILEGRGGYHVNQEFPFHADLSSQSVQLGKSELQKADAAEFGEQRAVFSVPVEGAEPSGEVTAKVRFAVCTEETCVPDTRTLSLKLGE